MKTVADALVACLSSYYFYSVVDVRGSNVASHRCNTDK